MNTTTPPPMCPSLRNFGLFFGINWREGYHLFDSWLPSCRKTKYGVQTDYKFHLSLTDYPMKGGWGLLVPDFVLPNYLSLFSHSHLCRSALPPSPWAFCPHCFASPQSYPSSSSSFLRFHFLLPNASSFSSFFFTVGFSFTLLRMRPFPLCLHTNLAPFLSLPAVQYVFGEPLGFWPQNGSVLTHFFPFPGIHFRQFHSVDLLTST